MVEQRVASGTGIPAAELEERRERLLDQVLRHGLSGYVLFGADYIQYFTGFWFLSNERPVIYAESVGGESAVFVPEFEVERTRAEATFERIDSYPEYPGIEHPMAIFARVLADLGIRDAIGADKDGYPGILGYQGPALGEAAGASVTSLGGVIESMMSRKSPNEVALIRESGRWCAHAHRLLQQYSRPGATEAEATCSSPKRARRSGATTPSSSGPWSSARRPTRSDGSSTTPSPRNGWRSRHPSRCDLLGRGPCRHELPREQRPPPVLAPAHGPRDRPEEPRGSLPRRRRPLDARAGMVFTVEPGLYDPTIGGFRHSDTVVVTEDGPDLLTDYPSDLESLTLPV